MRKGITRTTVALSVGAALAVVGAAPAFAGQAYPAPGFPSSNASCMGAALAFTALYGGEEDTFPYYTHGAVGPEISGDATSSPPGAVGEFNRTLAGTHGFVMDCVS